MREGKPRNRTIYFICSKRHFCYFILASKLGCFALLAKLVSEAWKEIPETEEEHSFKKYCLTKVLYDYIVWKIMNI